jgi:hypothetical protein
MPWHLQLADSKQPWSVGVCGKEGTSRYPRQRPRLQKPKRTQQLPYWGPCTLPTIWKHPPVLARLWRWNRKLLCQGRQCSDFSRNVPTFRTFLSTIQWWRPRRCRLRYCCCSVERCKNHGVSESVSSWASKVDWYIFLDLRCCCYCCRPHQLPGMRCNPSQSTTRWNTEGRLRSSWTRRHRIPQGWSIPHQERLRRGSPFHLTSSMVPQSIRGSSWRCSVV